jgi:hypothetical protein
LKNIINQLIIIKLKIMEGNISYFASAGDNQIVSTGAAILKKIIFGKDVGSAVVTISDSKVDGDLTPRLKFEGSTLMTANGSVDVDAVFLEGIAFNSTNQTNITFVWKPI